MSSPEAGANIDSALLSACRASGLSEHHIQLLVFQLNIRRLEHFFYAKPKDLQSIGLSDAEVNRLKEAVAEAQRSMQQDGQTFVRKDNTLHVQGLDSKHFINSTQIQLMDIIGEGTFAIVRRGIWTRPDGRRIDVAVKILRDMSSIMLEEVKTEASHLLKLQHPNLICMFGICQHPTMMVFELCEGGSLLDRLRDTAKLVPLVSTLLDYCTQIVKALAYLEKQRCVHRDVAARNILLSKDEKVVKVCDFGLMRNLKENEEMYVMGPQKKVPFSWCPPESLRHRKFSHASDVFAFGVTMWEIFSLGEEPWIGCRAIEVLKRLDAGERLEKPAHCSQQIYDLCLLCWKLNPDSRPRFNLLRNFLKEAEFNIAEVRESVPGSGDRPLKLDVGDRVIVIENTGVMWYGQNERTRQFGTFPRSCVYVHSKTAIAPAPTSPQIIAATTSPPLRPALPPSGSIPAAFMSSQQNSRISLPIKGSFIHAGHGDPRTGQTWGDPSRIDSVYLKNPVVGQPIALMNGATLVPSMHDLNSRSSSNTVTPSPKAGTSLFIKPIDYVDPFDAAQRDCFSPSKIELPKFDGNVAPSNGFAASTSAVSAVDRRNAAFAISARQSPPFHPTPSAAVSTVPAIPPPPTRTASVATSSSSATAAAANLPHPMASHSFVPSSQPVRFSQLPKDNPLVSEMKERLAVAGMGAGTAQSGQMHASASDPFFGSAASKTLDIRQPQSSSSSTSALPSACLIPTPIPPPTPVTQPVKLPVTQPTVPPSQAPVSFRQHPVFSSHQQHQSVAVPTPAPPTTIPIAVPSTSSSASAKPTQKPTPPPTLQQPQKVALPRPQSTSIKPSSSSGLPPPPTITSADRRSIIEKEVSSLLPPPSALLFGSNPTSNTSVVLSNTPTPSTSQSALVKSPSASQNTEIKKNATPVPASLPVVQPTPAVAPLSLSSVLVPTPLPQAHNSSATVVALETGTKRQSQLTDDDISNLITSFERTAQSQSARTTPTQVPIFALSDSTRCSAVALQGAQYQYHYGTMGMTPYHNNFYGWNVPNGYWNGDGMAAMAQSSIYPPIAYNPASIVAHNSTASSVGSSSGSSNGITRAEEMEVLYKEASFTDRSQCDTMMRECKGDTEEALKQLKMGYLQMMGLAKDATAARVALTRHEWNLNAAAESLL